MISINDEVNDARANGSAIVALESSIIAHGLPFPDNLETARAAEQSVREQGATPATIAIMDGIATIGLSPAELEKLADPSVSHPKAGARDIAALCVRRSTAGTTVGATATLAAQASIRVFATGGIGGVHRGDDDDVSADLNTLARVPVAVVSSGAKSILDIARTAERLETLGVTVIGFSTDEFPAFYSRSSGVPIPHRFDLIDEIATLLTIRFAPRSHQRANEGGVLIANPVPAPYEISAAVLAPVIERALAQAKQDGIRGKRVTPYLLGAIRSELGDQVIATNRALVLSNATLAAQIAVAYASRGG